MRAPMFNGPLDHRLRAATPFRMGGFVAAHVFDRSVWEFESAQRLGGR